MHKPVIITCVIAVLAAMTTAKSMVDRLTALVENLDLSPIELQEMALGFEELKEAAAGKSSEVLARAGLSREILDNIGLNDQVLGEVAQALDCVSKRGPSRKKRAINPVLSILIILERFGPYGDLSWMENRFKFFSL